jgi:DNA-binding beta-propeller fold protein YncE
VTSVWDENRVRDRLRGVLGDPGWLLRAWRGPGQRARKAVPSQRRRLCPAGMARVAAAVAVVAVPVGIGALGPAPAPAPAAAQRPSASPTVYAVFSANANCHQPLPSCQHVVIPISTATNKAGKPVEVGKGPDNTFGTGAIVFTPDGKTAYVLNWAGTVIPVSTATNRAGKPIPVGRGNRYFGPQFIAITPNGKTVYVANDRTNKVIPISTATNTAGHAIKIGSHHFINQIAITPDGKTAYVVTLPPVQHKVVIPVSTAAGKAGKPIRFGSDCHSVMEGGYSFTTFDYIAITPDGKTAYVACGSAIVPISTATNTAGKPIHVPANTIPGAIAITP